MRTYYIIDKQNTVVETGGDWDRFAMQNGGETAIGENVLGQSLWDFVTGDSLRRYLNALFFSSRLRGDGLCLPMRCDSHLERRDLRMTIRVLSDNGLQISHEQLGSPSVHHAPTWVGHSDCINCGGVWSGRTIGVVCRACRQRAAAACAQQTGDQVDPDADSQIDLYEAVRLRRAALAQDDPLPALSL